MTKEKGFKSWQERYEAKRQRESYRLSDLRAFRVAAALTQKDLADLIGSSQTVIADLERWAKASLPMLERLSQALKVAPKDLAYEYSVENTDSEDVQEQPAESSFEKERAECCARSASSCVRNGAFITSGGYRLVGLRHDVWRRG